MYIYFQQALPRAVIHRTHEVGKKWKLRFSPTKENRAHQMRISTKTDKDCFSPAVFRSTLEQKIPVIECYEWIAVFVYVAITFYSFALCAAKVPLGQCSRVSLL